MISDSKWKPVIHETVTLSLDEVGLIGELAVPSHATSIVAMVQGRSNNASHNRFIAHELNKRGLATLIVDLISPEEEQLVDSGKLEFDLDFKVRRIVETARWLHENPETTNLNLGLFGAGSEVAAAISAAACLPKRVRAVVSLAGNFDSVGDVIKDVESPTLLIVPQNDRPIVQRNKVAADQFRCEHHTETIHGATHLFEEEAALERVAEVAGQWFSWHIDR